MKEEEIQELRERIMVLENSVRAIQNYLKNKEEQKTLKEAG